MSFEELYSVKPNFDLTVEHCHWGAMSKGDESVDLCETRYIQTSINLADPDSAQLIEQLYQSPRFSMA